MDRAPAMTDMYDQALLGILQHVGNVQEFLGVLFGFLYRKTDFYRLLLRPDERLGFPPGVAQAMALKAFKNFEHLARQDDEKRRRELVEKMRKREAEAAAERTKVPAGAQEVEIHSAPEPVPGPDDGAAARPQEPTAAEETAEAADSSAAAEPPGAAAPVESQPSALPKRQEQFQTNPDSYNGAVRENYAWSQDYSDLEIKVPVPKHIVKGRQVSVDLSSSSIRVAVLEGSSQRVLVEGRLTHKINTESSLWSLEPGKCILVRAASFGHPLLAVTQRESGSDTHVGFVSLPFDQEAAICKARVVAAFAKSRGLTWLYQPNAKSISSLPLQMTHFHSPPRPFTGCMALPTARSNSCLGFYCLSSLAPELCLLCSPCWCLEPLPSSFFSFSSLLESCWLSPLLSAPVLPNLNHRLNMSP
ncbi:RNA-binding protein Nova-2 [Platysternon megacephalum]|uniref:RNA-binding protein Nova-2 n=1 Tax=Platysternon megacephalum TaxID=55544 RepID=A0A4D9DP87_9SAUR|nr:RNA-binding protein Nova-2 [Platysternon megacephalum]